MKIKIPYYRILRQVRRTVVLCAVALMPLGAAAQGHAGGTTWAVLVSGGMSLIQNHERYWNDCAWVYRLLVSRYAVPKQQVFVLMADGTNPADDMLSYDGSRLMSSSADFDGDGQNDQMEAATYSNMKGVMEKLSQKMTAEDHLFLFVIDHGRIDRQQDDVYICLWGGDKLYTCDLASMLNPLRAKSMSIVMGQCYAGAFIPALTAPNRVIATACAADEPSWASTDKPYDEFVYHWASAMGGADEDGSPVDVDENGDGRISMAEAFAYAEAHDSRPETPQLFAWPSDLADRMFMDGVADGEPSAIRLPTNNDSGHEVFTPDGKWIKAEEDLPRGLYLVRKKGATRKLMR